MYVADAKRLTLAGAKKIVATATALAEETGIAISVAVVDAGGHTILVERMTHSQTIARIRSLEPSSSAAGLCRFRQRSASTSESGTSRLKAAG